VARNERVVAFAVIVKRLLRECSSCGSAAPRRSNRVEIAPRRAAPELLLRPIEATAPGSIVGTTSFMRSRMSSTG
jgi:hypothetical protein